MADRVKDTESAGGSKARIGHSGEILASKRPFLIRSCTPSIGTRCLRLLCDKVRYSYARKITSCTSD
jgi:hypothetical protein